MTLPVVALLATGCSSDDPVADVLPEGKYPMEFTVGFAEPMSRVTESNNGINCSWSDGDRIDISTTQLGTTQTVNAELDASGNIKPQNRFPYWKSTDDALVKATYCNIAGSATTGSNETIELGDQSEKLAYVLYAETVGHFGERIPLKMSHGLAQVRVNFSSISTVIPTEVKIRNYVGCTVSDGKVTGTEEGYITMHREGDYVFVANVVPTTDINGTDLIAIDDTHTASLSGITSFEAGKIYKTNLIIM